MQELFSLGKIYPSDFLKPDEQPRCEPVEMKLMLDDDGVVKLEKTAPKEVMWGERYWYSSSVSDTMKKQLKDIVDSTLDVFKVKFGDIWIDIAGNTGYMLSQVPSDMVKINIDPVCISDNFRLEADKNCDVVIPDYFNSYVFKKIFGKSKATIVSCISMFYDLTDPDSFLKDVHEVLDDQGLFVMQLSYSPLMIQQLEFSNICHEHYAYYSLFNIKSLIEKNGFKILDCSLNNTNAGSFRIYMMKQHADINKFGSQTHRDVCNFRIKSLLIYESTLKLDESQTWQFFYSRIIALKEKTISFINDQKSLGKNIMAYGASTKMNTTLQVFELTEDLITAIAERSPAKFGTRTIGSNIPIISEVEMRLKQPDFLIIGPFQFLSEFIEREKEYLKKGGKFIILMPEFKIIGIEDVQ